MLHVGTHFYEDLKAFEKRVAMWTKTASNRSERAFRRIGVAWKGQAQKRIPVDKGTARQNVVTNTYWEDETYLVTETGTNLHDSETGVAYPGLLEFGTKRIAKGRVRALGMDPLLTDAQAIHNWPAKDNETIDLTSYSVRKIDGALARFNRKGAFVGTNPQEQMPWLRPAFNFIRLWAIQQIDDALAPPQ